jgi:hypothetical protein
MTDLLLKQKTANALLKMAINMNVSFTGDTCLFSRCTLCDKLSGHHTNASAGTWRLLLMVHLISLSLYCNVSRSLLALYKHYVSQHVFLDMNPYSLVDV